MNPDRSGTLWSAALFAAVIGSAFVLLCPASVHAIAGETEGVFGIDGRLSTLVWISDYSDLPSFVKNKDEAYSLQTGLRLMAGGRLRDRLSYEVHVVESFNLTSSAAQEFYPESGGSRYQALDVLWKQYDAGDARACLALDRFSIKFSFPHADLTVGRQAITFGKAYFWNPLDVFLPFAAEQIDRDYKSGVDAIRLDIPIGSFSGMNVIGVFGREITPEGDFANQDKTWDSSWFGSAALLRLYTNIADWDLSLQGGKIYGGYQIGSGVAGEVGPLALRFEAAHFTAEGKRAPMPFPFQGQLLEDHWTAVLGMGHYFENTFDFELECLYNGAGDPDNLEASLVRFNYGSTLHLGKHLLGLMMSYDIIPILKARLAWIYSFSDQSSYIQPVLTLSLSDEAELLFGAAIGVGSRPYLDGITPRLASEFGSYPNFYFIELKYYF